MTVVWAGLARALCFHAAWGYAPTLTEWLTSWDAGPECIDPAPAGYDQRMIWREMLLAVELGRVKKLRGRIVWPDHEGLVAEHERREALFPRKLRRARAVATWLSRLSGVRFVALCNTTALSHARDQGDLDFFVVTKRHALWQTRGLAALPYRLFDRRPRTDRQVQDGVCLSFFISEERLSLERLQLSSQDVYFRHWFLSLLPLYDDGISQALWSANADIRRRHPFAVPWQNNPDIARLAAPNMRMPMPSWLETASRRLQQPRLSQAIQALMNRDTRVVVNDRVLKFHVDDGRERFARSYETLCHAYGIQP